MTGTATTAGAREHARAQAGTVVEAMPVVPARRAPAPEGVDPAALTWFETVRGGGGTSKVLARGTTLRLTDLQGDACAHVLLFSADAPWERLNVADTVKVLWQAYVRAGHLLLSDQGRVLASVVHDTASAADTFCGTSTRAANERRYGAGEAHSASPAGREVLVLAGAKHGLERRDLPPSVSFFTDVRVEPDGSLRVTGKAPAGSCVELRAEVPLVVLVANVPHPLDPRPDYVCSPLQVTAWRGAPTTPDDPLWSATPEGERAFLNTVDHLRARGTA